MKDFLLRVIVGAMVCSGVAGAQAPAVKARSTATAVKPARTAPVAAETPVLQVPPAAAAASPVEPVRPAVAAPRISDTVREHRTIPGVARPREFAELKHPFQLPLAPGLAAVWQPLNEQLEVFGVDPKGALKGVWKHHNGYWEAAFYLSGPNVAPPGAPLAAVWYPLNEQLEVFTIGMNGALLVSYKVRNGRWNPPVAITPPGFAEPGAHVAAVFQPLNNQLEVFAIDAAGAVKLAWKAQNGRWQGPVALTPPGSARKGVPLTAVWQPLNEQLEVFWVDAAGAVRGVWKQRNRAWEAPFQLSAPGFANSGTKLASIWQPLNEQLELFAVDKAGGINVIWKAHNGRWNAPVTIGGPGIAKAGTDILALWNAQAARLDVVTVGTANQLIQAWKINNGAWKPGPGAYSDVFAQTGVAGTWPFGAALAGVVQPLTAEWQREIFTVDDTLAIHAVAGRQRYSLSPRSRITTENFGPIYGAHAAACSRILRSWSRGDNNNQSGLEECINFMGIAEHCNRQDAFVSVGYPPGAESPRYLQCSSRSHPDNVIEQAEHIARGVAEGLRDAAIATVVYSPEIAQGAACVNGVAFACASLAVSLAARAVDLPPEIADAVDLASYASACVNGDIVSCAKLGASGARAVGVPIPGEDAGQIALMAQQCLNEDYAACLRLGEKAAMAAGVPMGQINQAAKNAQDCYDGAVVACISLGRQAARAGIPVGGVADGADTLLQCSRGSLPDCQQLGQAIAAIPR